MSGTHFSLRLCLDVGFLCPFIRVDTQGLLDRVFPLSTEQGLGSDSAAGPSNGTQSYSFRALLKSPSAYSLRVLRVSRLFLGSWWTTHSEPLIVCHSTPVADFFPSSISSLGSSS